MSEEVQDEDKFHEINFVRDINKNEKLKQIHDPFSITGFHKNSLKPYTTMLETSL